MKKWFCLIIAIITLGCAGLKKEVLPKSGNKENLGVNGNCVKADYHSDKVDLKVVCKSPVIHVVNKLKLSSYYVAKFEDGATVVLKTNGQGILVFRNLNGKNVSLNLKKEGE